MFVEADVDGNGSLSYAEFKEAFKGLTYGLSENDINTLVALADENNDGKIDWHEFIPVGIESIKTFFSRNKALQRAKTVEKEINKEALKKVYWNEIVKADEVLQKKFLRFDDQKTGKVPRAVLRKAMTTTNFFTPKEINIIMRKMSDEEFVYEGFKELLFETRYELAKSRVMDTNNDKMAEHLKYEFAARDEEKTGKVHILVLQDVLLKSKKTTLTPM